MAELLEMIENEAQLDEMLSVPSGALVEMMKRLDGDVMILGIAGKMGMTLGRMAVLAAQEAGVEKTVYGVARFSQEGSQEVLNDWGIETIKCDLLNLDSVKQLPQVKNIIFMAGRKFGTDGSEDLTWAMNTIVPANVCSHFTESRIVAFSTGCVYPLVEVSTGGCDESISPAPVGEYAQSCLGRER
ncbi:MAG: NAD-dependent epimerase/dehydratase family protein, partial [Planctomycetota bacterium]